MHSGAPDADLDPNELRRRIQTVLANRVRHKLDDPSLTCAAVLVPMLFRDGEWWVLVTRRTEQVEHHKGQMSFPGGACDPEDASLEATALREAHEEVGIPPEAVELLGVLDDMRTVTDFVVTPFVGVLAHPISYRLNKHEVAEVVEVPLSFMRDPGNLGVQQVEHKGQPYEVLVWDYGPHAIWGATARILKGFLDLLQ
jgi:8-oxo-dGTP pyrophosphatase MutT (NUDIX family)